MKLKNLARKSRLSRRLFFWKQPTLLVSLLVTGLLLGLREIGSLQRLEMFAFDQMMQWKPETEADQRFLIVGITESDLQARQRWPLSDLVIAQLLAKLQQYQPRVIGLDLYRDIPQQPGHQDLLQQLQADNVITITHLGNDDSETVPPPSNIPVERISFNDMVIDPDGVLRRNFMFAALGEKRFYSLSLKLSLNYLNSLPEQQLPSTQDNLLKVNKDGLVIANKAFLSLKSNSGGYQTIDSGGYQILINYRSDDWHAKQVTLTQVLQDELDPAWVKDKIVLIGTVAPSLKDVFYTPYSSAKKGNPTIPGVIAHAQMTSQIISAVLDERPLFWFWHQGYEYLWIWVWSGLGGWIALRLKHPLYLSLAGLITLGGLGTIAFILFIQGGWIPLVPTALGLIITSGIIIVLHNAFHDSLTGLPNRALFIRQLQWAIVQTKEPEITPVVIFLGLDRFKVINASIGHKSGDQILMMTVKRLKDCLRLSDQVARVGGDQFALLLQEMRKVPDVISVAERVRQELKQPFRVDNQEVFTTVSLGIAFKQADSSQKSEDLLHNAQTAMYRAKALGGDHLEVFAMDMQTQVVSRFQLETDLRQAIERQEFQLYYQPIISLKTGLINGFEALIRWNSPERGFVSPGQFIPVAEETGLIIPLGKWIIEEACSQMYEWHKQLTQESPLMISVNLSRKQFAQDDLIAQIQQTLQETLLDPRCLKLEITESMVMNDVDSAIALLVHLKELGIHLSMDDFGTGYSSLSYLHRFPLDTLKVDQSFVRRMEKETDEDAIVRTIIMLGHNLGMDIIAEGIETAEQLAILRKLGCEYGQGYFFAKPLPSDQATELLKKAPRW